MSDFFLKTEDTSPALQITCQTSSGSVVNLTSATVRFIMKDDEGTEKVNAVATIVDAAAGTVKYEWVTGDTDTAGLFISEFEVTFADSTIETFPNVDYIRISITEDLN